MRNLLVKSSAVSVAVLMGLVSSAALSQSQSDEHTYFGPRLGLVNPDSDRWIFIDGTEFPYDSGFSSLAYGLQFGHRFSNNWEIRTYYDRLNTDVDGASSGSGHMYGVDGIYNFRNGIYAGIGINNTRFNQEKDAFLRGTLGYRFQLSDRWNMGIEYAIQNDGDFTDQYAGANLNYMFGFTTARPAPRPEEPSDPVDRTTDSDGDGVPDYRDQCPGTPRGHVVDEDGCTIYVEQSISHDLVVNFEFDSAEVQREFRGDIEELAELMREHEGVTVEIAGHTDLIGPQEYNQELSERRAQAVKDELVNRFNISANRLSTVGYGMTRPLYDEISLEVNHRNRRIEAELSTTEEVPLTEEMQRRGY
ncbi:OprF [Aliidiomarina minuta]|uniref:OprF n=1 Tax=Aliidiomarina minuta TaxID=880057 RepID=A0A432W5X4_9GAMM|nr:OmpA family protein [Aliidiomarina minuta]RUO25379.1 OprF [Aliidiomarina minuta]